VIDRTEDDEVRFILMFLRPEVIERCAKLVQVDSDMFDAAFRDFIDALCDDYKPFRRWLFCRLCSSANKLVDKTLAMYILFGKGTPTLQYSQHAPVAISSKPIGMDHLHLVKNCNMDCACKIQFQN